MGGGLKPVDGLRPSFKVFLEEDIRDIITCFKFGDDHFRDLASAESQILPFSIDFDGRPYNTLTLPCEGVIQSDFNITNTAKSSNPFSSEPPQKNL